MRLILRFAFFLLLASALHAADDFRYFFYQATRGNVKFYVLGSMHMGRPDDPDYAEKIYKALGESKLFILEGEVRKEKIRTPDLSLTYLPDGQTIPKLLTKEENQRLEKICFHLGVNPASFEKFQPWFLEFMFGYRLAFNQGFVLEYGTEHKLLRYMKKNFAKGTEPHIFALEAPDEVLRHMHALPLDDQMVRFRNFLNYSDKMGESNVLEMQRYWREGDDAQVLKIFHYYYKDISPERNRFAKVLLYDRNRRMAERLGIIARYDGTYFVVTGALHLIGENNILDYLKKAGFKIERL